MPSVTYYCPHCETLVSVQRDAYLADKSVTAYPLEGWSYVGSEAFDDTDDIDDIDGIRFVCGESDGVEWDGDGCGEPFYLNFVRHEAGEAIDHASESEYVELNVGPSGPRTPGGPEGPPGPDGG